MEKKVDHLLHTFSLDLEAMRKFSGGSVFALICRSKRRLQVYASKSSMKQLSLILDDIEVSGEYTELAKDLETTKVELVVLETGTITDSTRRERLYHWIKHYESRGYRLYKDIAPIRYKIQETVEPRSGRFCYCLYLVNSKSHKILVGIFHKKSDMNKFKKDNYNTKRIQNIIYHESVLNKEII